jgi:hypothetical protein
LPQLPFCEILICQANKNLKFLPDMPCLKVLCCYGTDIEDFSNLNSSCRIENKKMMMEFEIPEYKNFEVFN